MSPNHTNAPFPLVPKNAGQRFTPRLAMLVLLAALAGPSAQAGKGAGTVPESKAAESCECTFPWREYTRQATPEVEALFAAAANVDEAAFSRLIATIPELSEYAVDGQPLLAVLLSPARNLPVEPGKRQTWDRFSPEQAATLRAAHAATLPAKLRMLALALQHGASVKDISFQSQRPPLHLVVAFGSPEIVRLLLQHGADVNAVDARESQTAIEFALDNEFFIRMTYLPVLVDPVARTEMLMALLAAGAGRPFAKVDKIVEREEGKPAERPAANYLLWPALAALTRGSEIMEAFANTGTRPVFDADTLQLSPLAHAARSGNLGGVRWLKKLAPRRVGDGDKYGQGERYFDTWLLAACWALYPMARQAGDGASVDEILGELIQPGMPWAQENELSDDERNPLLSNRGLAQATVGKSLLHHLVFTGKQEWVRRVLAFGAPVDGADKTSGTPLLQAVRDGNPGMVRLLLAHGANPLAEAGEGKSPLREAIAPDPIYGEEALGAEKLRLKEARRAALVAMLGALSPAQKVALGQGPNSPLRAAFDQYDGVDGATVAALLQAGVPLTGLDSTALASAVHSADPGLVGLLLDHGLPLDEGPPADGRPVRPLLIEALAGKRPDLLPRLLQAGANPNLPDATGHTAVAWAVALGDDAALDTLLAGGGRFELAVADREKSSLLELALISPNEKMLARLPGAADLSGVCLQEGASLRHVVLDSSDAFWAGLLGRGLGRPAEHGACAALEPLAERLLSAMLAEPASFAAGWRGTRLSGRLRDLTALVPLPNEHGQALLLAAQAAGRDDLVAALAVIGVPVVAPAKAAAVPVVGKPSAADRAMQQKLVGHYYLENQREVGSEILLRANGQFEYLLAYGATDEAAAGQWRVRAGRVLFTTPPPVDVPGRLPYQRIAVAGRGAADENPASFEVLVSYQGRPAGAVEITALGCVEPAMAVGRTEKAGWRGNVAGPLCHLVLRHPQINAGRSFVYQVPLSEQAGQGRRFAFAVEPSLLADGQAAFKAEMSVDKGALLWRRAGRTWRYVRQ
ncbi:MAG: ankyrin repeat domain-containing protein [Azonexus sp.]